LISRLDRTNGDKKETKALDVFVL